MTLNYIKTEPALLRDLGFDEKWLQKRIDDDPSILGLGPDLSVIAREHAQPTGGRIDFLMFDPAEDGVRYEIEVMLGRVDESHIIRTLEYWDIERTRFPKLQHRAVVVAEEITNRFFNIIALLNRAIPIIAIQLSAFKIDEKVVLNFTTVLNLPEPEGGGGGGGGVVEKTDRAYWDKRSNPGSMKVVDRIVKLTPTPVGPTHTAYNKSHIALGTTGTNFVWFYPRKVVSHCQMELLLYGQERSDFLQKLADASIYSAPSGEYAIRLRLSEKEITDHEQLVKEVLTASEKWSRE